MGAMGILSVIQQGVVIGPLTRRVGAVRVIKAGCLRGIAGFLVLAAAPSARLLALRRLDLHRRERAAATQRHRPDLPADEDGQGAVMGLNNSFQSLGRAVGPLWAGFAFDHYSTLSFWSGCVDPVDRLCRCDAAC